MRASLSRYRIMAYLVGIGLLVLTVIGIPLQYAAHYKGVVEVVGPLHGALYIIYLVAAFDLAMRARFTILQIVAMIAAGLCPFLAFIVERWIVRRVESQIAAGRALRVAAAATASES